MIKQNDEVKNQEMITCPYCFKRFDQEYVHFKAETAFVESDLIKLKRQVNEFEAMDSNSADAKAGRELLERMQNFLKKEDQIYEKFWKNYPGSNWNSWEESANPVISRVNETSMLQSGGYYMDEDGFVQSAIDVFGKKTSIRICPICHNPLPPMYGKYPAKFISTVGITSSGKTVYLSQLIKQFGLYMTKVGITAWSLSGNEEEFVETHPVEQGIRLPIGTPPASLPKPLFYNIVYGGETITIVLYDIAGENCVDPRGMERFGPFIANSDAISLILDPAQFAMVRANSEKVADPTTVVNAMYNAFLGGINQKSDIPIAICLSKSDKLRGNEMIHENSNIFTPLTSSGNGFNVQQYNNVQGEVRKFLNDQEQGKVLINAVQTQFSDTGYFAFSSLDCDVEILGKDEQGPIYAPIETPNPLRIEEPILWILWRLGIISENKLEPNKGYKRGFLKFFK